MTYGWAMPSVRVSEHSELPPDMILTAARDFTSGARKCGRTFTSNICRYTRSGRATPK